MKHSIWILAASLLLIFACENKKGPVTQLCDQSMGLRKDCVLIMPKALPAAVFSQTMAGESTKLDRAYVTAPPLIPHSIEGIEVNAQSNGCLMCHGGDMPDSPSVPPSHMQQAVLKYSQAQKPMVTQVVRHESAPNGIDQGRYVCLTCHVPQAGNLQPLVVNQF